MNLATTSIWRPPPPIPVRMCVLIPAKDERLGIGETVSSVLAAGAPPKDVYVMDDGSSDGTGDIAWSYSANVLRNEKDIGKAWSIRRAARHWTLTDNYDLICLMDADTEVNADYFQSCIAEFADPNVAAACGRALSISDWHDVSLNVMRDLLRQKFTYSILRRKLLSTFTASSCDSRLLIILFSRDRRPRNTFHAKHVLDREDSPLPGGCNLNRLRR